MLALDEETFPQRCDRVGAWCRGDLVAIATPSARTAPGTAVLTKGLQPLPGFTDMV